MGILGKLSSSPKLTLGYHQPSLPLLPLTFRLNRQQISTHKHIIGKSGMGKSKFLISLFLQLMRQGIGVSFIDPANTCEELLAHLVQSGFFQDPASYRKVLYIEFLEQDFFLPFNVLNQPRLLPKVVASHVLDSFHRCWPSLDQGVAPRFDNLIKAGTQVLIANKLPLTAMQSLLTNKPFRHQLLSNVTDLDLVYFFLDRFDEWSSKEAPQMKESTLTRIFLLTDSDVLKYSLGQTDNILDLREIMDQGVCVIYNLSRIQDQEAQRLLGCLLTRGYEAAAKSRADLLPHQIREHHLIIDEFATFSAQSEEALQTMLSQTRKFGLFSTMAHQTYSQASDKLRGALQNADVRVAFRVGSDDAYYLARSFGSIDPEKIKAQPLTNHQDEPKNHPVYLELPAQWQVWVDTLETLPISQALVQVSGKPSVHIRTLPIPSPKKVGQEAIERVKREYRLRLMKPVDEISLIHQKIRQQSFTVTQLAQLQSTPSMAYTRLYQPDSLDKDKLES